MDQHEFRSILQQDLVVLSHCLFEKITDELVFHKPWTANQDALNHWWTIKSKRERIEKVRKKKMCKKKTHKHTCLSVC